ncbi:MAG: DMT family transporter [Marinibacterium sp.]|nr:DMT family transporter [Marinibacterium sp.]
MTDQKTLSPRVWAELVLLALIWGGSFLSIRLALDELPVLTVVFHRVFWAAILLWIVVALRRVPLPRDPRIWAAFLVMGCLNNIIPFGLMSWGQLHIESGLTAILNASTAIFGVLTAALAFDDERLSLRRGVGVTIGFAGVVITIGPAALLQFDLRSMAQIAVLGGALSYALAAVWGRRHLAGLPPVLAAAGMVTGSAIGLAPLMLMVDGPPRLDLAPVTWGAIAYYALVATAGAYLLYYRVLRTAGSGNLLLVTLLIPPVAIGLGAVVLGETLTPGVFAGSAVLALGLLILNGRCAAPARD